MPPAARSAQAFNKVLAAVRSGLEELVSGSSSLRQLEEDIVSYKRRGASVTSDMVRLAQLLETDEARNALENSADRVADVIESFEDYVRTRRGRDDAAHSIGRTEVGGFLRKELRRISHEISLVPPRGARGLDISRTVVVTLPVPDHSRSA